MMEQQTTARSRDLQQYFDLLENVDSLEKFREFVSSSTSEGASSTTRTQSESLHGLAVFLEQHCSEEERDGFFTNTLKFIVFCASSSKEEASITPIRAQESQS